MAKSINIVSVRRQQSIDKSKQERDDDVILKDPILNMKIIDKHWNFEVQTRSSSRSV